MLKPLKLFSFALLILATSCNGRHLIKNTAYREKIESSFSERKLLCSNRDSALFNVFNERLNIEETEALKFLYAFMPLNDLADKNGDFFLANVRMSLRARNETIWGKTIPENIFLHYVLPCRVNNENLDSFRIVYYSEILDRIKSLPAAEAALEINHWCHEKVSYQGADSRTSAPMSTILSARGRCGEESTFTVSALRTAGIPARQVYTPRWAHTDDNHAWVEFWADGKWQYTGACEPEPVPDHGWFTEPARRAMLIHTKSFGAPYGEENTIITHRNFSEVNNLSKYAVTKRIYARVLDSDGKAALGADVEFQLYNYAEYYPIARIPAESNGICSFETGLGDLLVWAHKDDLFAFEKITVAATDTVDLILHDVNQPLNAQEFDLGVPVVRTPYPLLPEDMVKRNAERVDAENIIRLNYISSWMKPVDAKHLASETGLDSTRVINAISRSMGNYKEISKFISGTPDSLRSMALDLLEVIADKDLRDTKASVLTDHLLNAACFANEYGKNDKKDFILYILNPRIANEIIVPWRSWFLKNLPDVIRLNAIKDPSLAAEWLNEKITLNLTENYYNTPITPVGVADLMVSDKSSRDICLVAICRTLGIPSRLEPGSNIPQYYHDGKWIDVYMKGVERPQEGRGFVTFVTNNRMPVPEYYTHFTLARFAGGRYNTLDFEYNKKISDFERDLPLAPGHYMLVTGNRLNDSRILSGLRFFDLNENQHLNVEVNLRFEEDKGTVLGKLDQEAVLSMFSTAGLTSRECSKTGMVVIWIDPEKEPTKHIFNDLPLLRAEFDSWGGKFLFLSPEDRDNELITNDIKKVLPAASYFSADKGLALLNHIKEENNFRGNDLPFIIQCDNSGNILFESSGYRIGIGEQILRHLK